MNLDVKEFEEIFSQIIDLKIPSEEIKEILLDLNKNNLPLNAFIGAANVLKARMVKVVAPENAVDVCGTGGDKLNTLNISTAVSFVVAASGVVVAKHGNKAVSSNAGSADIFAELGVRISASAADIERDLAENKLCFLFAPFFHDSLRNISSIRRELGVPTIFNFLGPLLNPANTRLQMIGVSRRDVMKKMLQVNYDALDSKRRVYVVHGVDGMDEISLCSDSYLLRLEDGKIFDEEIIDPSKYGFKKVGLLDLLGRDPKYNAMKLRDLLSGEKSAYRDIVLLNSAFVLKLAGRVDEIGEGVELAKSSIDKGLGMELLAKITCG
jgi:anthranilate phosphoribosyltransferase